MLDELRKKHMSGYALMNAIKETYNIKPSPGSVYPLLECLKEENIIQVKELKRKKIYSITAKGRKRLKNIAKKKLEILNSIEEGVNLLCGLSERSRDAELLRYMINEIKGGKLPFAHLNPELMKFRNCLLPYMVEKENKKIAKIKKILKQATKGISSIE